MKDLTKGKPGALILEFALPLAGGLIFQLAYSLADTRIIGQFLGEDALAAVGATTTLSNLLIGFLNGLTNGFALIASNYFGMKAYDRLKKTVGNSITLGIIMAVILTIVSIILLPAILGWLHVPTDHMAMATAYIRIILIGLIGSMMYNVCASLLRAIGDSLTPLIFLIISTILNVALDLLFICQFHMHVEGAAIATIIAQLLSFVACAIYMLKRYEILRFSIKDALHLDKSIVSALVHSGLSMGLMSSLVNFGSVILQSGINGLGADIIIAHTGARKISEIFMMPFSAMGMTMATYAAQNYGAGQYRRIYDGFIKALGMTFIWCVGVMICAVTIAPWLVGMVIANDKAVIIETASLYLRVDTLFYLICAVVCIGRNTLQGMNVHMTPVISSFLELIGKCLAVWLLVPVLQYWGVILAEPISWGIMVIPLLVSLVPAMIRYKKC